MGSKDYELSYDYNFYWDSCNNISNFASYYQQLNTINKYKPNNVLEIGVGNRLVTNQLKNKGINVTTVDINPKLNPDYVCDIRHLEVINTHFDLICAFEVLEHIRFSNFEDALISLKKHSSKYIIISLPIKATGITFYLNLPKIKPIYYYLNLPIPLRQKSIQNNTAHFWEIDKVGFEKSKIINILRKHFNILEHYRLYMNPRHYMFVLQIKNVKEVIL